MKKVIFTLCLLLGFAQVQAQVSLGVRGGLNYANITGDDVDDDYAYKFGAHGGLFVNYAFSDLTGIQLEANYSNKGFKNETTFNDSGIQTEQDNNVTLNYIDVPVLFRVTTGGLFFELGPQVSYLVSAKNKYKREMRYTTGGMVTDNNGNVIEDVDEETSVRDDYEKLDFGYVAGLGYMSASGFGIGVRYNGGIKSIVEIADGAEDVSVRNSVFQLSLSYRFIYNDTE